MSRQTANRGLSHFWRVMVMCVGMVCAGAMAWGGNYYVTYQNKLYRYDGEENDYQVISEAIEISSDDFTEITDVSLDNQATIESDAIVIVPSNVEVAMKNGWTNDGKIVVYGTLTTTSTFTNNGTIEIKSGGSFVSQNNTVNSGMITIDEAGSFSSDGFTNESTGVITNNGSVSLVNSVNNGGTITNSGSLSSTGTIINSGTIENTGTIGANIDNSGEVINEGDLSGNVSGTPVSVFGSGSKYYWQGDAHGGDGTTWTNGRNWKDENDNTFVTGNYPGSSIGAEVTFPTSATVTVNIDVTIAKFNLKNAVNIVFSGSGTITTGTFDGDEGFTETVTIENNVTLTVTETLWGDGDLTFINNGTLLIPGSGANLDYKKSNNIKYEGDKHPVPYSLPDYYKVLVNGNEPYNDIDDYKAETAYILNETFPAEKLTLTFKKPANTNQPVAFPYRIAYTDTDTSYHLDSTSLSSNTTGTTGSIELTTAVASKDDTFALDASNFLAVGKGFTITIKTPDGAFTLAKITYTQPAHAWTGATDTAWEKPANWNFIPAGFDFTTGLASEDISVGTVNRGNYPTISAPTLVNSLAFTDDATLVIDSGGELTLTDKLTSESVVVNSGTITLGTGASAFNGGVTNSGTITCGSGNIVFNGAVINNGTLTAGTGAVTFNEVVTNNGEFNGNTGDVAFYKAVANNLVFDCKASKVVFNDDYLGGEDSRFIASSGNTIFYGNADFSSMDADYFDAAALAGTMYFITTGKRLTTCASQSFSTLYLGGTSTLDIGSGGASVSNLRMHTDSAVVPHLTANSSVTVTGASTLICSSVLEIERISETADEKGTLTIDCSVVTAAKLYTHSGTNVIVNAGKTLTIAAFQDASDATNGNTITVHGTLNASGVDMPLSSNSALTVETDGTLFAANITSEAGNANVITNKKTLSISGSIADASSVVNSGMLISDGGISATSITNTGSIITNNSSGGVSATSITNTGAITLQGGINATLSFGSYSGSDTGADSVVFSGGGKLISTSATSVSIGTLNAAGTTSCTGISDLTIGTNLKTAYGFTVDSGSLTVNGTTDAGYNGSITTGGSQTYNGALTLGATVASTVRLVSSESKSLALADVEIKANNTLAFGSAAADDYDVTVSGNWTNNGTLTANQSTVTFRGNASISGNSTFYNFTDAAAGTTLEVSGTQTVSNTLTLSGTSGGGNLLTVTGTGAFNASTASGRYNGQYLSVGNDIQIQNEGVLTPRVFTAEDSALADGATLSSVVAHGWKMLDCTYTWNGGNSTSWDLASNWNEGVSPDETGRVVYVSNVINHPALDSDVTVAQITIPAGASLSLNSHDFTISSAFTNYGTVYVQGAETITIGGTVIENGTWHYAGTSETDTVKAVAGLQYNKLIISGTISIASGYEVTATNGITLGTADGVAMITGNQHVVFADDVTLAGDVTLESGTGEIMFESDVAISVGKRLTLGSDAEDAYTVSVAGDWTNNGTLAPQKSTITFTGAGKTVSGNNTFASVSLPTDNALVIFSGENTFGTFSSTGANSALTFSEGNEFGTLSVTGAGTTVRFGAGKTQKVTTLVAENAMLRSTTDGSAWNITIPSTTISGTRVKVCTIKDSAASELQTAIGSTDGGGNSKWQFAGEWIGGTATGGIYGWQTPENWTGGVVPSMSDTVTYAPVATTFPTLTDSVSVRALIIPTSMKLTLNGKNLTVSGTESESFSNSGTVYSSGTETVTLAAAANETGTWNFGGGTIRTISGLTYHDLKVTGSVTVNENTTVSGDITISDTGSLTENADIAIGGDFTNIGTFTALGGTLSFTGSGTHTLTNAGGSTAQFNNIAISAAATLSSASVFEVTGNWTNNGTFTATGSSSISFTGTTATVSGNNTFASVSLPTDNALVTFSAGNTFGTLTATGTNSTLTFSGTNEFTSFTSSGENATLTFSEGNEFGTLSVTGAGTTARFGAGKTQKITTAFTSRGADGSRVTLTTDAGTPSADKATWWTLDIPESVGKNADFAYTLISYSESAQDIAHDWGATVSETDGMTENWFWHTFYWTGAMDGSWETTSNWSYAADGEPASRAPSATSGFDEIVVSTKDGGTSLALSVPIKLKSLEVRAEKSLDAAGKTVTVTQAITNDGTITASGAAFTAEEFNNNGTLRLTGAETITAAMRNGAGSTVEYYGTELSALPWNGDASAGGEQYENLVFAAGSGGTVGDALTVNGTASFGNGNALTLSGGNTFAGNVNITGSGALSLSAANDFEGAVSIATAGDVTLSGTNIFAGGVVIASGGEITLNSVADFDLGNTETQISCGSLHLTGAHMVTAKNVLSVTNALSNTGTLVAGGAISASALTNNGTVTLGGNTLSFGSYTGATDGTDVIRLAGGSITSTDTGGTIGTIQSSGSFTLSDGDSGALVISSYEKTGADEATATINGGTAGITISSAIYRGSAVSTSGRVTLAGTTGEDSAGAVTVLNGTASTSGNLVSGEVTVSAGSLTLGGALISSGAITLGDDAQLTLGGDTSASSVTIGSGATLSAGSEETDTHTVTVTGALTNGGTFIARVGAVTVGGEVSNNGTFTCGSGAVTFNGAMKNEGSFTGGSGAIEFNGDVTNSGTITVPALSNGTTALTFGGTYDGTGGSLVGAKTPDSDITPNPTIEFKGKVTFGSFTSNGDKVKFSGDGAVIAGDTESGTAFATAEFTGAGITLNGNNTFATATFSGNTTFGGSNTFASFSCTPTESVTLTFKDSTTQTITGADAGSLTLTGTAENRLNLAGSGSIVVTKSAFRGENLSLGGGIKIEENEGNLVPGAFTVEHSIPAGGVAAISVIRNGWKISALAFTWNGSKGSSWNNAENWDVGIVPGTENFTDAEVTIPDGLTVYPATVDAYTVQSLVIGTAGEAAHSASLAVGNTFAVAGTAAGSLTNYGTIRYAGSGRITADATAINDTTHGGTVEYSGGTAESPQVVTDFGDTDYANLVVSGVAKTETAISAGGSVTVSGGLMAGEALSASGNITVGSTGGLTAKKTLSASGDITVNGTLETDGALTVTGGLSLTGNGTVSLNAANGGQASTAGTFSCEMTGGTLSFGNEDSDSFAVTSGGISLPSEVNAVLAGTITSAGGAQSYGGAVTLRANANVKTSGGGVSFGGTVENADGGAFSLTVSQGSGTVSFAGAVGTEEHPLGALSSTGSGTVQFDGAVHAGSVAISGASVIGAGITTAGAQTYTGAVRIAGTTVAFSSGGDISFKSAIDGTEEHAQSVVFAAKGTDSEKKKISVTGAVGGTVALGDISFKFGDVTLGGDTSASSVTIGSGATVSAGGAIAFNGDVTNSGTITVPALSDDTTALTFGGAYLGTGGSLVGAKKSDSDITPNPTIEFKGKVTFGTFRANGDKVLFSGDGAVIAGDTESGTAFATAQFTGDGITLGGDNTFTGAAEFTGTTATVSGNNTFASVSLPTDNVAVTFSGTNEFTSFMSSGNGATVTFSEGNEFGTLSVTGGGTTLTFAGGTTQTVSGAGADSFTLAGEAGNLLVLASSGNGTANLVVSGGAEKASAKYLAIGTGVSIAATAGSVAEGAFAASDSKAIPSGGSGTASESDYVVVYKNGWNLSHAFTFVWQGDDSARSNDWNVAENWDIGIVPGVSGRNTTASVIIPEVVAGAGYPVLSSDDITVASLAIVKSESDTGSESSATLTLGTGALTVTGNAAGSLTNRGTVTISAGDLRVTGTADGAFANNGTITVTGSGAAVLSADAAEDGTWHYKGAVFKAVPQLSYNKLILSGNVTVLATVSATNGIQLGTETQPLVVTGNTESIIFASPVTLANTATLSADAEHKIDFESTVNGTHALTVGGNAEFSSAAGGETPLGAVTVNGNLTTEAALTAESLAVTGASTIGGNVTTTGTQTYTGATTLTADITAQGGGAILFGSTVGGTHGLTLITDAGTTFSGAGTTFSGAAGTEANPLGALSSTGSGSVQFDGAVYAESLLVTGASVIGADITTAGAQTYTGAATIAGSAGTVSLIVTDGTEKTISFGSSLEIASGKTLQFGSGGTDAHTVTVAGDVTNAGTVTGGASALSLAGNWTNDGTFMGGAGIVSVGGALTNTGAFVCGAGAVTVDGITTNTGTFTGGSGALTFNDSYSGAGTLTASSGAVTFAGNADFGTGSFTASSATTSFAGNADFSETTFTHNSGTVRFTGDNATVAGNTTTGTIFSAAEFTGDGITLGGGNSFIGTVSFTGSGTEISGNNTFVTATFSGNTTFGGSNTFASFNCETGRATITLANDAVQTVSGTADGSLTLRGTESAKLSLAGSGQFVVAKSAFTGKHLSVGDGIKIMESAETLVAGAFTVSDSAPASEGTMVTVTANGWKFGAMAFEWTGVTSAAWETAANWNPAFVPGSANFEDAIVTIPDISAAANYPATAAAYRVQSLVIGTAGAAAHSATLAVGNTFAVAGTAAGTLTNYGTISLSAHDVSVAGTDALTNSGTIRYAGNGRITDDATPINDVANGGTVEYSGGTAGSPQVVTDFGETDYVNLVVSGVAQTDSALTASGDVVVTGDLTAAGAVSVEGALTTAASLSAESLSVAGETSLGGNVTTTGAQTYTGATTLTADITAQGGAILFGAAVVGAHNLTLITDTGATFSGAVGTEEHPLGALSSTGSGTMQFDGAVHAESLLVTGASTIGAGITTAGIQTYTGNVTVNGGTVSAVGAIDFGGTVETAGGSAISGGSAVTFSDTVTNGGTIAADSVLSFGGTVTNSGTISGHGTVTFSTDVTNSGTITVPALSDDTTVLTFGGAYLGTDGSLVGAKTSDSDITPNPTIEFKGDVTFGTFRANGDKVLFSGDGAVIAGDTESGTAFATAEFTGDGITLSGNNTFAGAATFSGANATLSGGNTFAGNVTNTGTITLADGDTSFSAAFTNSSTGTLNAGAGMFAVTGILTNAGTITGGAGALTVAGTTENTGTITLGAGSAEFAGAYSGNGTFTASSTTTAFGGDVNFSMATFEANGGAVLFTGENAAISGNATDGTTFSTATFSGASQTISGNNTFATATFSGNGITLSGDNTIETAAFSGANQTISGNNTITTATFSGTGMTLSGSNIFGTATFAASTTFSGSNEFASLACETGGVTLTFADGTEQKVSGTGARMLALKGTDDASVTLATGGTATLIVPAGSAAVSVEKIVIATKAADGSGIQIAAESGKVISGAFKAVASVPDGTSPTNADYIAAYKNGWNLDHAFAFVWTGGDTTSPTDWNTAANWDIGIVPGLAVCGTETATVTIPDSVASGKYPMVAGAVTIHTLSVGTATDSAAEISMGTAVFTVTDAFTNYGTVRQTGAETTMIGGAFTNYGTVNYGGSGRITSNGTTEINDAAHGGTVEYSGGTAESPLSMTNFGSTGYANLVISGNANATEQIATSGNVTVSGTANLGAGLTAAGDVTIGTGAALKSDGNVAIGGKAAFGGAVQAKSLAVSGTAEISGGTVTTADGGQQYGGDVTLAADTAFSATGGGIIFSGVLDAGGEGGQNLTFTANAVSLDGAIGGTKPLGTIRLVGATPATYAGNMYVSSLVIESTASLTAKDAADITPTLTVTGTTENAGTITLGAGSAEFAGAYSGNGTLTASSGETSFRSGADFGTGTFTASSTTTAFGGDVNFGTATFEANGGAVLFTGENAAISGNATDGTTLSTATFSGASQTVSGNNTFATATFSGNGITLSGDNTIETATFSGANQTISGNNTFATATFSGTGTTLSGNNIFGAAIFNGDTALLGSNEFATFTAIGSDTVLTFGAGKTQTVTDSFEVRGQENHLVTLKSSENGSRWTIDVPLDKTKVFYAKVSDSHSVYDSIFAENSVNNGNNINWNFLEGILLPEIAMMLSPVGGNQMYAIFSRQITYDSKSFDDLSLSEQKEALEMIPDNLVFVTTGGNPSSGVQTDWKVESAEHIATGKDYTVLLLHVNRKIKLDDIRNLSIYIKFMVRDDTNHAHALSDFALNVVTPLYAYADGILDDSNAYGSRFVESHAVRDFTADSSEVLRSEADITVQTRIISAVNGENDYVAASDVSAELIPDLKTNLRSSWISDVVNERIGSSWRVWLSDKMEHLASGYNTSPQKSVSGTAVGDSAGLLWNFTLPNLNDNPERYGWKGGDEVQFVFKLFNSDGKPIEIDLDGTGKKVPLYALSMPKINLRALPFVDLWSFRLKDAAKQRGGVTIQNNVINVNEKEQTIIQVDMPSEGNLNIYVMTLDGNIVQRLEHGRISSGTHFYTWNGTNTAGNPVARGLYFVRVVGNGIDETRKVMCVKE